MTTDFARIKEEVDLLAVIMQETGLQMKGKHLDACPFCGGHGCFSVQNEKKTFKCFQCPAQGDVFNFFEQYHQLDQAEALKRVAAIAGFELTKGDEKKASAPKLSRKDKLMLDAATYYHEHMLVNGGKEYLVAQRGHDMEVLKQMLVGWSDGNLLDHLQSKGYEKKEILEAGLAKEKELEGGAVRHIDFFGKGLAIFPHVARGRVMHFTMKDPKKERAYQLPAANRHKDWRFYNQEAIGRYNEIILVEGENDTLSVLKAKVKHVAGLIGQVSEEQIKTLKSECRGKKLYLWMDNDEEKGKPYAKGIGYVRKICRALINDITVRVIVYPGEVKDPDDYLRDFDGDRYKEIKRLQDEAVDYITWEIGRAALAETMEAKFDHLRDLEIFRLIAKEPEIQQQIFTEKMMVLGFSRKAIEQQLENGVEVRRQVAIYMEDIGGPKNADPNQVAAIIHKSFAQDGRFFYDRSNKVYLLWQHHIYEVASNRPFNALMKKMTTLLPTKEPGRSVWESLASEGYNTGRQIDVARWVYTDRATDTIYLNLNSQGNIILKVSPTGITEIENGLNDDHVLLQSSKKIMPFNFRPDADIQEGFAAYKELVFDQLTCAPEQRYLITCWMMTCFLLDMVSSQGHMKFAGGTGCGKSTAAKFITILLYGSEHLEDPSAAAAFALASQNPLLVIDNLESDDFTKSIMKFLLLAATRGQKSKRTSGTESDTTEESPRALVLITAIEPFIKPELINRTLEIEFSKKYCTDGFIEDEVTRALIKKRDLILSAMIKLIQKDILPNLAKRRDYITILQKEYRGHSKDRMNEFWALMMLLLEKMLPHIPFYDENHFMFGVETGDADIRQAWIEYQNGRAKDSEVGSNNILKLLDGLVREYLLKMREVGAKTEAREGYKDEVFVYTHPEYGIEMIKTKPETIQDTEKVEFYTVSHIEFEATSKDLVYAFDRFCKNNGQRNPYLSAAVFGSRLRNDMPLLAKGGWELVAGDNSEMYSRIVRGQRFLRFRHTVVK